MRIGPRALILPLLLMLGAVAPAAASAKPVCRDIAVTVEAGHSTVIAADCSDPAGRPIYPALGSDVQHGSLEMNTAAGGWTYRATPGYGGTDSFTYVGMTRTSGATPDDVSDVATVTITVTAPPPVPVVDTDGDGIPDKHDACPKDAGTQDFDGCPPDTDGDDVPDATDKCPTASQGLEGAHGCPAAWRPALKVASERAARAVEQALRNPVLRARFKSTGRLPVVVRLPAGLPRHRWLNLAVIPLGVPPDPDSTPAGRSRCGPNRRCRVVLKIDPKYIRLLTPKRVRRKGFACATSMWRPGLATDSELAKVRLIGIVPG